MLETKGEDGQAHSENRFVMWEKIQTGKAVSVWYGQEMDSGGVKPSKSRGGGEEKKRRASVHKKREEKQSLRGEKTRKKIPFGGVGPTEG